MSARLSVTVITSVDTRLNAATATISVRMMNIRRFSICTASNQLRLVRVQSRTLDLGPQARRELAARRGARACRSFSFSCTPLGPSRRNSRCASSRWIQRQRAVVLVVAGLEGADHGELLEPRHHAGRRDLAARRDQRHRVAGAHAERARQLRRRARCRQSPGCSVAQRGVAQLRGQVGDCALPRPARCRAPARRASSSPRASSACAGDERRRADHLRVRARLRRGGLPVGQRAAVRIEHLDVRDHAQHAVAHFLLEAVHHRQHDDQRGHAERDAEHRHAGDEGDEAVAAAGAAGAGVAPAELPLEGPVHVSGAGRPKPLTPTSARRRAWANHSADASRHAARHRRPIIALPMHLIIPFAGVLSEAGRHAAQSLALPRSRNCWPVHSRRRSDRRRRTIAVAAARAWRWRRRWAGRRPTAACPGPRAPLRRRRRHRRAACRPADAGAPGTWAPTRCTMADPDALDLDAADARALFDAVQPLFADDGFALHWGAPLRWYLAHDEPGRAGHRLARPRDRPQHRPLDRRCAAAAHRWRAPAERDADAAVHAPGQRAARGAGPADRSTRSGSAAAARRARRRAAEPAASTTACAARRCGEDWARLGRRLAGARCRTDRRAAATGAATAPRSPCAASAARNRSTLQHASAWQRVRALWQRAPAHRAAGGAVNAVARARC